LQVLFHFCCIVLCNYFFYCNLWCVHDTIILKFVKFDVFLWDIFFIFSIMFYDPFFSILLLLLLFLVCLIWVFLCLLCLNNLKDKKDQSSFSLVPIVLLYFCVSTMSLWGYLSIFNKTFEIIKLSLLLSPNCFVFVFVLLK
jgi:hypothetical protein